MKLLLRVGQTLVLSLAILALHASPLHAQCNQMCGDITANGSITSADIVALMNFLYRGDSIPANLECTDVDDFDLLSFRDLGYMNRYLCCGKAAPVCPPGNGRIVPAPTEDYRIVYSGLVPPNESSIQVPFYVVNYSNDLDGRLEGVSLAMTIRVEGLVPTLDSTILHTAGPLPNTYIWFAARADLNPSDGPPGSVAAGFLTMSTHGRGSYPLMTIFMHVTPSPAARQISIELVDLPPLMDDEFGVPRPVNTSMVLSRDYDAWVANVTTCPLMNTGDVNADDVLTSADIIATLNYVFKSGAEPLPCIAAADVDCTGTVSSSDVIYCVNHVFKGGPAPCDVCTLIPGTWSCMLP